MHTIKRLKNKTITVLLAVAIALSCIVGAFGIARVSAYADGDTVEYPPTSAGISNPNFDSTSGSYPATPSSWTGAAVGNGSGKVVSGVVDLSDAYFNSGSGNKDFELDQYPEYKDDKNKPQTIFGANTQYVGSDEKALLINTAPGAEVAYAYSSSDMTFSPNSFYRVSAWVKTGDFAPDTGATIKLSGLGENCSFLNINTVKDIRKENGIPVLTKLNDFGWDKYTFYVRTSASYSRTVKLVLGIGDAVDGSDEDSKDVMPRTAKGYAFFDTVSAERISAHDFATETLDFTPSPSRSNLYVNTTGNSIALDLYEPEIFKIGNKEIGTFSDDDGNKQWTGGVYYDEYGDNNDTTGVAHSIVYNSEIAIPDLESSDNIHGFTQNPWAPLGRAEHSSVDKTGDGYMFEGKNANILMISTYDGKAFQKAAYGIASPTVKIDRFGYYRFSVWIKGDSIDGSSGISILVKGKRNGAENYRKLGEYSGLSGDSSDAAHYGWKEHVVYIKGSMLYDYDVKFELWLGTPASKTSGIAMFDNVTFTKLSYSEYTGMSGADGGNVLSSIDASPSDTGITNGNFNYVGDFEDELEFPMPAADWTYITPDTAETVGFSNESVNTDNAVHGIIPTDNEKFNEIYASGAIASTVKNPATMTTNISSALLISSTTPTAIGYRSSAATVSSGSAYKFTVEMAVDGVTSGNGAALVLKTTAGNVLATIQNIKSTHNAFKTYTFYVNAPYSGQTLYLEIWLGLGDRIHNTSNLSNGNVYVKSVGMTEWTAADENGSVTAEYNEILERYKTAIKTEATRDALDYAVYSFDAPSLDYYDVYAYGNGSFGIPYQWSRSSANGNVISGIFDPDNMHGLNVYDDFDKKDINGNMLYIFNTDINRTTYTYDNTVTTEANKYYRLDVDVKVRVTDEIRKDKNSIGATVRLTGGASSEFANIKDTTTLIAKNEKGEETRDYETFKTYSFIISSGANGGDIGLEIVFGGSDRSSYIQGKLIVANIRLTEVDNLEYENAQNDTDNEYVKTVALSEDEENPDDDGNTEEPSSEIQWWIIPTVIFSAALLAVIIIIMVVKIREYVKKKKKVTYSTEYDRSDTIREIERLQKDGGKTSDKKELPGLDVTHDELDDDFGSTANEADATETEISEESEEANASETETADGAEPNNATEASDKPKAEDLDD